MVNCCKIFIILILCSSCTKFGKNVTIKGRVVNPITGQGHAGIELNLQRSTLQLPGGYKTVKSVTTDANGNFEISRLGLRHYVLQASVGNLYELGWYENGTKADGTLQRLNVKRGKTMHVDFHAVEYGSLNLKVKNTNCFNSFDKIEIYFDGAEIDSKQFTIGKLTELNGCIDITDSPVKTSMGLKYFHWVSTKNNIATTVYDTFFVYPDQNTEIQVFY